MNQLIPIHERDNRSVVSARELYEFLEPQTRFNDWIIRVLDYGFIDGVDYSRVSTDNERFTVEYALNVDCAKEISMLQKTERGKQARQYFIQKEREALDKRTSIDSISRKDLAKMLYEAEEEKERVMLEAKQAQKALQEATPKVLFADSVTASNDSVLVGELAKILKKNGVNIGQHRLFKWLRENGYLMKQGNSYNMPTQRAMDMNLFDLKKTTINRADGTIKIVSTTKVTGVGLVYFINKFLKAA